MRHACRSPNTRMRMLIGLAAPTKTGSAAHSAMIAAIPRSTPPMPIFSGVADFADFAAFADVAVGAAGVVTLSDAVAVSSAAAEVLSGRAVVELWAGPFSFPVSRAWGT
jgi:hypothetical protein